jgi:hypothetical protein
MRVGAETIGNSDILYTDAVMPDRPPDTEPFRHSGEAECGPSTLPPLRI